MISCRVSKQSAARHDTESPPKLDKGSLDVRISPQSLNLITSSGRHGAVDREFVNIVLARLLPGPEKLMPREIVGMNLWFCFAASGMLR